MITNRGGYERTEAKKQNLKEHRVECLESLRCDAQSRKTR